MKTLKEKHNELTQIIGEIKAKKLLHAWYDRVIKRERKRKSVNKSKDFESLCERIILDISGRTGLSYSLNKDIMFSIEQLLKNGYTEQDFQHVHQIKTEHWLNDSERIIYLIPATLYRKSNFPKYVQQWQMKNQTELNKKRQQEQRKLIEQNKRKQQLETEQQQKMNPEQVKRAHEIIQQTILNVNLRKINQCKNES